VVNFILLLLALRLLLLQVRLQVLVFSFVPLRLPGNLLLLIFPVLILYRLMFLRFVVVRLFSVGNIIQKRNIVINTHQHTPITSLKFFRTLRRTNTFTSNRSRIFSFVPLRLPGNLLLLIFPVLILYRLMFLRFVVVRLFSVGRRFP
jgi:hypothetical protein